MNSFNIVCGRELRLCSSAALQHICSIIFPPWQSDNELSSGSESPGDMSLQCVTVCSISHRCSTCSSYLQQWLHSGKLEWSWLRRVTLSRTSDTNTLGRWNFIRGSLGISCSQCICLLCLKYTLLNSRERWFLCFKCGPATQIYSTLLTVFAVSWFVKFILSIFVWLFTYPPLLHWFLFTFEVQTNLILSVVTEWRLGRRDHPEPGTLREWKHPERAQR